MFLLLPPSHICHMRCLWPFRPGGSVSPKVVAAFNIAAWSFTARELHRGATAAERKRITRSAAGSSSSRPATCSAVPSGRSFRSSTFPVETLFDTWISRRARRPYGRDRLRGSASRVSGRCYCARRPRGRRSTAYAVSATLVPMIVVAEICSWYSVITTSNIGHVFEEMLWGIGAALVVITMARIRPRCTPLPRTAIITWCAAGFAYVAYMFTVDVPDVLESLGRERIGGTRVSGLADGVSDALQRRLVTWEWQDWNSEVVWMTLYFSVAVWISISLVYAPAAAAVSSYERNGRALPSSRPDPSGVSPAARPPRLEWLGHFFGRAWR